MRKRAFALLALVLAAGCASPEGAPGSRCAEDVREGGAGRLEQVVPAGAVAAEARSGGLAVVIDREGRRPVVTLENGLYRAVVRENPGGGKYENEHAIRDWVIKESGLDQVSAYLDASTNRGVVTSAEVTFNGPRRKSVRLIYGPPDGGEVTGVSEYTIRAGSPVIEIRYEKYPPWTNLVDIGAPGGLEGPEGSMFPPGAETRIYGQEEYRRRFGRGLVYHEESYWNTYDDEYASDPPDAGPLNYRGHLVMAVANTETGVGFGRVLPVRGQRRGGVRIVKLLWNTGFECFASTGEEGRPPFTGYLYFFTDGLDAAIERGKRIAEGAAPADYKRLP